MHAVSLPRPQTQTQINWFLRSVYHWMAIGLGLTGLCAYSVANNAYLHQLIFGNSQDWSLAEVECYNHTLAHSVEV